MVKGCLFSPPPPPFPLTHPHVSKQQINNISFRKSKLFNVFIGHCQPIVNNCRKIIVKSIKLPYQSQNWPRILNIPKIIYALNASNTNGLIFTKILKPSCASLEKPLSSLYITCLLDLKTCVQDHVHVCTVYAKALQLTRKNLHDRFWNFYHFNDPWKIFYRNVLLLLYWNFFCSSFAVFWRHNRYVYSLFRHATV